MNSIPIEGERVVVVHSFLKPTEDWFRSQCCSAVHFVEIEKTGEVIFRPLGLPENATDEDAEAYIDELIKAAKHFQKYFSERGLS